MHEVLVKRLGGLSLPRKRVVRLTDRPNMTLDVYRGRKRAQQQWNRKEVFTVSFPKNQIFLGVFSSPEPKAPGELIV